MEKCTARDMVREVGGKKGGGKQRGCSCCKRGMLVLRVHGAVGNHHAANAQSAIAARNAGLEG